MTTSEAEEMIKRKYIDEGYYTKITVIIVAEQQVFYVYGFVMQKGSFPHRAGLTLSQAVGAAGGIESVFTALSVKDQIAPPTINLAEASPECDLDYVPNTARKMEIKNAISNSFGFGGTNAVVAMKRFDE